MAKATVRRPLIGLQRALLVASVWLVGGGGYRFAGRCQPRVPILGAANARPVAGAGGGDQQSVRV
eukprot:3906026-Prorocentrum_lima.AAC.1